MKNKLGNVKKCKTLIKHGMIKVNDEIITNTKYLVNKDDKIIYNNVMLKAQPFSYYMMINPLDIFVLIKILKKNVLLFN